MQFASLRITQSKQSDGSLYEKWLRLTGDAELRESLKTFMIEGRLMTGLRPEDMPIVLHQTIDLTLIMSQPECEKHDMLFEMMSDVTIEEFRAAAERAIEQLLQKEF